MAPAIKNTMFGKYFKHVLVLTFLAGIAYPLPQMKEAMAGAFAMNTAAASEAVTSLSKRTTDASASVTSSRLVLSYDRQKSESALSATAEIVVNGGAKGINVYREGTAPIFTDANNPTSHAGSQSVSPIAPNSRLKTLRDESGMLMYVVPANKKVTFKAASQANPQKMFAGTYYASVEYIYLNKGTARDTVVALTLPANKTNKVTIIGEKGPYIKTLTSPIAVGEVMTISGERLESSKVVIDGKEIVCAASSTCVAYQVGGKEVQVNPFPLYANGYHTLELINSKTGASNRFSFIVTGGTPAPAHIDSIDPVVAQAGATITVRGTDFQQGSVIRISGKAFEQGVIPNTVGNNLIQFVLPSLNAGTYDVQVSNNDVLSNHVQLTVTTYSCPEGYVCVPPNGTTTPSIKVLSPNGGEVYKTDDVIQVGYFGENLSDTLKVYLYSPIHGNVAVATGLYGAPLGTGKGTINIGQMKNTPPHFTGQFKVTLCDEKNVMSPESSKPLCDSSDSYFTIVKTATPPDTSSNSYSEVTPVVSFVSQSTEVMAGESANDDVGFFRIKLKVTAVGGDIYLPSNSTLYTYRVDRNGVAVVGGSMSSTVSNNTNPSKTANGNYLIEEGESQTLTLSVAATLPYVGTAGQYRAALTGIKWGTTDSSATSKTSIFANNAFVTSYIVLN
ncbi:MAG: Peptidoglycan-binding protein [Patescibacteria group bacterium]|nr:Peptidoglycan-binding protein [Patescibacteria group bacterium]